MFLFVSGEALNAAISAGIHVQLDTYYTFKGYRLNAGMYQYYDSCFEPKNIDNCFPAN